MVSPEEVERIAVELPEVTEGLSYGRRTWKIGKAGFVWERPFSKADIRRFGTDPIPEGPILAVRVEDLAEKEAILAAGRDSFFTTEHFDGYPAVLIQLDVASAEDVREAIIDAWLACASPKLAEEHASRLIG